jgi:hypothetical protein
MAADGATDGGTKLAGAVVATLAVALGAALGTRGDADDDEHPASTIRTSTLNATRAGEGDGRG